jgi:hypothetical protein
MAIAAARENKDPYEIARFYEDAFVRDLDRLNIVRPDAPAAGDRARRRDDRAEPAA